MAAIIHIKIDDSTRYKVSIEKVGRKPTQWFLQDIDDEQAKDIGEKLTCKTVKKKGKSD